MGILSCNPSTKGLNEIGRMWNHCLLRDEHVPMRSFSFKREAGKLESVMANLGFAFSGDLW